MGALRVLLPGQLEISSAARIRLVTSSTDCIDAWMAVEKQAARWHSQGAASTLPPPPVVNVTHASRAALVAAIRPSESGPLRRRASICWSRSRRGRARLPGQAPPLRAQAPRSQPRVCEAARPMPTTAAPRPEATRPAPPSPLRAVPSWERPRILRRRTTAARAAGEQIRDRNTGEDDATETDQPGAHVIFHARSAPRHNSRLGAERVFSSPDRPARSPD